MNVITFYSKLSLLVRHIPKYNILIIDRGHKRSYRQNDNIYCFHNSTNRIGKYLDEVALENKFLYPNIKFQKKKEEQKAYSINKKWINSAVRRTPHLKEYLQITQSFRQFVWVYVGIKSKQIKLDDITSPYLLIKMYTITIWWL